MEYLKERWTKSQLDITLANLQNGKVESPFGKTKEGLDDLRGVVTKDTLEINKSLLESLDLSQCEFEKVIVSDSTFNNVIFSNTEIRLFLNKAELTDCYFLGTKLNDLVSGDTTFESCTFADCIFQNLNFESTKILKSDFVNNLMKGLEFGDSHISGVRIDGVVQKCFFRGVIENSNFESAIFDDCSFENVQFNNCLFEEARAILVNWNSLLEKVRKSGSELGWSSECTQAYREWKMLWEELGEESEVDLLSLVDLVEHNGQETGTELYQRLKELA